ncbi:MAG: hypothetical protein ACK2UB_01680 [Anaerolineales bacterium]
MIFSSAAGFGEKAVPHAPLYPGLDVLIRTVYTTSQQAPPSARKAQLPTGGRFFSNRTNLIASQQPTVQ